MWLKLQRTVQQVSPRGNPSGDDDDNDDDDHLKQAHLCAIDQLYKDLDSSIDGLSQQEVTKRQLEYGPNELKVKNETSMLIRFLRQFKNFFAILLIFGGLLAILAEQLDPGQGNLYIAIALFAVVLLNAIFSFLQEEQSERIMESFRKMLPSMYSIQL